MEEFLKMKEKINKGIQEFHSLTFYPANWIKCNLYTRNLVSSLISENGKFEETDISVLIDYDISDRVIRIGMGEGPTFSEIEI